MSKVRGPNYRTGGIFAGLAITCFCAGLGGPFGRIVEPSLIPFVAGLGTVFAVLALWNLSSRN